MTWKDPGTTVNLSVPDRFPMPRLNPVQLGLTSLALITIIHIASPVIRPPWRSPIANLGYALAMIPGFVSIARSIARSIDHPY
jgi:hypothetical protein